MRLTTVILIASLMQLAAATKAQKVSVNKTNASLKTIIKELRSQTGFDFVYKERLLAEFKPVTIKVENTELDLVLTEVFKGQPFAFEINSKTVIVKGKEESSFLDKVVDRVSAYYAAIDVYGKVVDETGQPIGGASIVVKSTGKGVSSKTDGTFMLKSVEEGSTLTVKFIGYEVKEFTASKDVGVIKMKIATNELDLVQVQAYGVTSKRLTTSNITSIRADDIGKQPISNPLLALQGRVPGLIVTPLSGFAGGTVTVRIQGYNSIRGGNDPFYVVDGVPYSSYTVQANPYLESVWGKSERATPGADVSRLPAESSGNPLNYINAADIESIEILKDADATAIYGSKAANGAIIITTKKGKNGPMMVDASIKSGFDQITGRIDLLAYDEYIKLRLEAKRNNNQQVLDSDYDLNGFWGNNNNRDYQNDFLKRKVSNHNAQLSISGGNGATNYRVNLGYQHQDAVVSRSLSDRKASLASSLNTTSSNKKFSFSLSIGGMLNDNRLPYSNPIDELLYLPPNSPQLYNSDGTINWAIDDVSTLASWYNPMASLERSNRSKVNNLNTNLTLSYELLPNLKFLTSIGYNRMDMENVSKTPLASFQPLDRDPLNAQTNVSSSHSQNYIVEPQLTYTKHFAQYKIDVLAGATLQKSNSVANGFAAYGFPSDSQMDNLPSAAVSYVDGFQSRIYRYNAGFARISLNRNDEFLLNITARRDGSSRFGPANRFENFAAIGAGWVFTKLDWLSRNVSFISFGKLRVSYGITGNDQIGDYTYLNLYQTFKPNINYQGVVALVQNGILNEHLQWETNRKMNFGIDLALFKDKLTVEANYAVNRSDNMLMPALMPQYIQRVSLISQSIPFINFPALVENKSSEIIINNKNITGSKFAWETSANFAKSSNKLKSMPDLTKINGSFNLVVGESIRVVRAIPFAGIDPLTGTVRSVDRNGNPVATGTSSDDRTKYIDLIPSYSGGISNKFIVGSISLDVFLQFQKQIFNRYLPEPNYGLALRNAPNLVLNRWKNPGDVSSVAKSGVVGLDTYSLTDAGYEDASFLRVKNIALSWKMPAKWTDKLSLKQVTLQAQIQNLWTLTNYSGLDPETGGSALPLPRTMVFGFNVSL